MTMCWNLVVGGLWPGGEVVGARILGVSSRHRHDKMPIAVRYLLPLQFWVQDVKYKQRERIRTHQEDPDQEIQNGQPNLVPEVAVIEHPAWELFSDQLGHP
jgi:hypothetical protein